MSGHEVRDGWQMRRVRTIAKNVDEKTNDIDPGSLYIGLENVESWTGRMLLTDTPAEPESTVNRFKSGDVLFGKLRPYLGKVLEAHKGGVCSTEFLVLRALNGVDHRFLRYALASPAFIDDVNAWTYGVKMPRANWERFGNLLLAVPSAEQQRAIADFLDRETAEADALITQYERLLEFLEERRVALITQAVTKGLDPNGPMKDSGIEWIGEIPTHWETPKMAYLASIRSGNSVPDDLAPERDENHEYPVYGSTDTIGFTSHTNFTKEAILIARVGAYAGSSRYINEPGWVTDNTLVLTLGNRYDYGFARYLMSAVPLNDQASKTAQPLVTGSLVSSQRLPCPPLVEQRAIANRISEHESAVCSLLLETRRAIALSKERRSALITAAVTGDIDVKTYNRNIISEVA